MRTHPQRTRASMDTRATQSPADRLVAEPEPQSSTRTRPRMSTATRKQGTGDALSWPRGDVEVAEASSLTEARCPCGGAETSKWCWEEWVSTDGRRKRGCSGHVCVCCHGWCVTAAGGAGCSLADLSFDGCLQLCASARLFPWLPLGEMH